jgi:hypothetical protein
MGPVLRSYLGIAPEAYDGHASEAPSAADSAAFGEFLRAEVRRRALEDEAGLVDLLDELVAMDQPEAAISLFEANQALWTGMDFRGRLSVGVAAMLAGALELAEEHFRAAQALLPAEPAPYVNLVQILRHEDWPDEALTWCLAGLDADRNNLKLWDLYALLCRDADGDYFGERVLATAQQRVSWAGLALAADVTKTADPFYKLSLLEKLYHQGERDRHFLVELTAAMGVAGEYGRIPPLVWQAEQMSGTALPWQLYAHAAQAHLALGKTTDCLALLHKARRDPALPPEAVQALAEMEREALEPPAATH